MKRMLGLLVDVSSILIMAGGAGAATLNVAGGQLLGASGVIVDGSSYNVEFLDGTCIDLYNGCDSVSDFTFQTQADAGLASQALLDQVLLDGVSGSFDMVPELTDGCTDVVQCFVLTPHALSVSTNVETSAAGNASFEASDAAVFGLMLSQGADTAGFINATYAVWSPVPEPGTALLMGLGLIALSVRNRREI